MKNKKILSKIIGIVSFLAIVYCCIAYIVLQHNLVPSLTELPQRLLIIGNISAIALLLIGINHIVLLIKAMKMIDGKLGNSLFIVFIILSGITLLSDITILLDIAREYLFLDISSQFTLLYGFTALHMVMIVIGFVRYSRIETSNIKLFKHVNVDNDNFYLSIHQIGLISSVLGLIGVMFAVSGIIVPDRFSTPFMLLIAVLALVPLAFSIAFWCIKLNGKKLSELFDEKQVQDSSIGSLVSIIASFTMYLLVIVLDIIEVWCFGISFWILLIMFFQIMIYSTVVLLRNR